MIIAKLLGKIEKMFGGDALESRWYEAPVYEYTLEKEVSEVTVRGHGFEWDKGDVVVYELTDDGWAKATVYPFYGDDVAMKAVFGGAGTHDVQRVSGVEDVHAEKVGETEWNITVDVADGVITNVERETMCPS